MRASHYALALYQVASEQKGSTDDGALVKKFVEVVEKNGHTYLLPRILKSFQSRQSREVGRTVIHVSSAVSILEKHVQELLKKEPYSRMLSEKHRKVIRHVDDTLIGGVVVRTGTQQVDASYKRALTDIYKSLTANI